MESLSRREQEGRLNGDGASFVPALVGGMLCVVFLRTGILSFFFLVPLGFIAAGFNLRTLVLAALTAVLGNGIFSLNLFFFLRQEGVGLAWDMAFFSLLIGFFTWAAAPAGTSARFLRFPGVYRLMAGSILGFLSFLLLIAGAGEQAGFFALLHSQAEALSSLYVASVASAGVDQTLAEQYLNPEIVIKTFQFAALRGGGFLSCLVLFFISRQFGRSLARLFRHRERGGSLVTFHAEPGLIWVLSSSLLLVLLIRLLRISSSAEIPEIILWNMVVICAILYLAQGGGVISYFMVRLAMPPFLRFIISFVFVILLFRPGINAVVLGLIILLGIAENWVPFRAPKINGPPPTPGV